MDTDMKNQGTRLIWMGMAILYIHMWMTRYESIFVTVASFSSTCSPILSLYPDMSYEEDRPRHMLRYGNNRCYQVIEIGWKSKKKKNCNAHSTVDNLHIINLPAKNSQRRLKGMVIKDIYSLYRRPFSHNICTCTYISIHTWSWIKALPLIIERDPSFTPRVDAMSLILSNPYLVDIFFCSAMAVCCFV